VSADLKHSESVHDVPHTSGDGQDLLHADIKLKKKDFKRLFDSTRELDGWERYRALIDASDEAYDLIDISNREARFALIVMGGLNALPLLLLTKMDIIDAMTRFERMWMVSFLIGYALLLLYFILQAIEALHPGRFRPSLDKWSPDAPDFPIGVRYYEDVIKRTDAEHWTAWQHVRLSQLNAELAVQLHGLALKNDAKHRAVRRLFIGLRAMAFMLGTVFAMYLLFSWT
jgi:hypothetical protein